MKGICKQGLFRLLATMCIVAIISSFATVAFAEDGTEGGTDWNKAKLVESGDYTTAGAFEDEDAVEKAVQGITADNGWSSKEVNGVKNQLKKLNKGKSSAGDTKTVELNGTTYYLSDDGVNSMKNYLANTVRGASVKSKVEQIGTDFNIKADVDTAATSLAGFANIVSWIVGILVFLITISMTFFTACDVCFLTMPVFRNKCEDLKATGGVGTKSTSGGDTKLMFITDDALNAYQEGTTNGKNPLGIYLKKRIIAFIMLGLVLFVLLTGNINIIVNLVVNIASGIMEALASLGGGK